jgi:hypothetical protein
MLRSTLHSLLAGLVRRTWFVLVISILVCAGFTAHALDAVAATERLPPAQGTPLPGRAAAPVHAASDGTALVVRNMFCSTCDAPAGPGPTDASFSGRPAMLIATSLATQAADSRATVRVLDTEVQGSWGLGERIPGVGTVRRIGGTSIDVVDGAGQLTRLSLLEKIAATGGGGGSGAGLLSRSTPDPAVDPFADRIKKIDDHTYEVDRNFVRELVTGAAKPGGIRMIPIVKNGEVQGVRMASVRAGSLPAAIGMKSGDVLDAINGDPLKSAQQMLDLYAKLDQLDSVELGGTRAGKPLAIILRLR